MKACWVLCPVTTLSATAAWAESPLKSLQFEQQKQLVLKAVKENVPRRPLSDTDFANKILASQANQSMSGRPRWRKSEITSRVIRQPSIKSAARKRNHFSFAANAFQSNGTSCA